MFFDHDDIDGSGILERKEAETSWATWSSITHDSALQYLAKLREVLFQWIFGER